MYRREISTCLSRGMSTPAMRAIGELLALLLLVLRIRADHHHVTVPPDDLALLAARLHGRTNFHRTIPRSPGQGKLKPNWQSNEHCTRHFENGSRKLLRD